MRHHNTVKKFGREKNQRKALERALMYALIRDGRIKTTEPKAKALRPLVEKLITTARKNTAASKRKLIERLPNAKIINKLVTTIGPKYATRAGGYTRIIKTGTRLSDGAKMAIIELV